VLDNDEMLDADAAADHRRDVKRSAVITAISLALVLVASTLIVVGGIPA